METITSAPRIAMTIPFQTNERSGCQPSIAILGAGAAGLCMAMRLRQRGIHSFTLFEKSDRVGGTWRENTYPGAGCDIPSHLYSFSFEPKTDWSRVYAHQPEIQAYLEQCARKHDILPHIRFGVSVESARWDEAASLWRLRLSDGSQTTASVLVSAVGQLNRPLIPKIPGTDTFAGVQFHSARWNHAHDLAGRRVAVIGNGASAIQFIPRIAEHAGKVTIFQRHANWILPRGDRMYGPWQQWAFRNIPGAAKLVRSLHFLKKELCFSMLRPGSWLGKQAARQARRHLKSQIRDAHLRKVLTPDFTLGCKRVLISDDYYPAVARPNVEIVTNEIARIQPGGVFTHDGVHHAADTLIWATGFESTRFLAPLRIVGRGGRSLADAWAQGAEAYLGVAVAGFPNLFLLYGPNTNLGHNSILFMIECQVNYILEHLNRLNQERLDWIDVRPDAQAHFNEQLQSELGSTVWQTGCTSWYKTADGKITNNWSSRAINYWRQTRRPDFVAFTTSAEAPARQPRKAAA